MVDNEQSDGYDNGNQVDDEVDDEAGNFKQAKHNFKYHISFWSVLQVQLRKKLLYWRIDQNLVFISKLIIIFFFSHITSAATSEQDDEDEEMYVDEDDNQPTCSKYLESQASVTELNDKDSDATIINSQNEQLELLSISSQSTIYNSQNHFVKSQVISFFHFILDSIQPPAKPTQLTASSSDEQLDVFRKKKAVDWNQPMTSKQSDELQQIEEIDDEMTDLSQFTNRSSSVELNNPEGIV